MNIKSILRHICIKTGSSKLPAGAKRMRMQTWLAPPNAPTGSAIIMYSFSYILLLAAGQSADLYFVQTPVFVVFF